MKKLLIILATVTATNIISAASVDWSITGSDTTVGINVYLITSLASSYESASQLISSAVGSGVIENQGRAYGFSKTTTGNSITETSMQNAYLVVIDGNTYTYISVNMANYVYDMNKQEASKGFFETNISNIQSGTQASFVPEPTSGLLMILGVAGLALRRKRA